MNLRGYQRLALVGLLSFVLVGDAASARGPGGGGRGGGGARGGGGYRGGGSVSRSSYSGHGSVRYSSPSRSYSRPSTPSYARPSAPTAPQRPARASTPSRWPSTPAATQRPATRAPAGGSASRSTNPWYSAANRGSIVHGGTVTGPGGTTVGGGRGPRGGAAVGAVGSEGGAVGAARGPRGGSAAGAVGPNGGAVGAARGPWGGGAAGVRGPGGSAAGAVWGPGGHGVAGARGPYGNRVVTNLPDGAWHNRWHDNDYWCVGFSWYRPCWVDDDVHYAWIYPPVGYYYPSLPPEYNTTVINNTTYYESDGVYYQEGEQDGEKGYVVAEAPEGADIPEGEDPFEVLQRMCDYISGLDRFSAVVQTTREQVNESGDKAQFSARRALLVSRPDKFAMDVSGDNGERRSVFDGKTISVLDRTKNFYTVVEVPDTIDAAIDTLAGNYGVVIPLADLLYKDMYDRLSERASAGQYLGLHAIDAFQCHHLAFSTPLVDWEVWIDSGDKPVPRRITIDSKQNALRSRFAAELTDWSDSPEITEKSFAFALPADAKRIEIERE